MREKQIKQAACRSIRSVAGGLCYHTGKIALLTEIFMLLYKWKRRAMSTEIMP